MNRRCRSFDVVVLVIVQADLKGLVHRVPVRTTWLSRFKPTADLLLLLLAASTCCFLERRAKKKRNLKKKQKTIVIFWRSQSSVQLMRVHEGGGASGERGGKGVGGGHGDSSSYHRLTSLLLSGACDAIHPLKGVQQVTPPPFSRTAHTHHLVRKGHLTTQPTSVLMESSLETGA